MNEQVADEPEQNSVHESQESADILISKNLLPPALILLPRIQNHLANSLLPMLPLPNFVGVIPTHQALQNFAREFELANYPSYLWIGTAFTNVIYRKYNDASYQKIDNFQQNWNVWACDLVKLLSEKQQNRQSHHDLSPFYSKKNEEDHTLIFESRFESGNLSMVSKVNDNEYNLLLQNDINTTGYSQWFFFKVSNMQKGQRVKFNILNMYKENSLFKDGMRIVCYSVKESAQNNISWHRAGQNIDYFQNGYSKSTAFLKRYFTLSWTHTFDYSQDEVYFAYNYPFTYSHLDTFLQKFEIDPIHMRYFKRASLCRTLAGNRVDVLTITEDHPDDSIEKAYIIISGRVHPGQTVSSYVVNGILQFLMSDDDRARKLRQNFIFKVVPMLNPDGVIHGNYRSNLSGSDLNRKWETPSKSYQPEIYHFKNLVLNCHAESEIALFCDFHGHSMKKNAFVYGCHDERRPFEGKQFPFLVSKLFEGFSFKDCSFLSVQAREGSSRSVLCQELEITNVYTLQSSFCGPEYENIHFSVQHFQQLGKTFCEALMIYFEPYMKEKYFQAAIKNKFQFQDDHKETMDTRARTEYFAQLYQNKTCLFQRVNSQNSQGSEPEVEAQNIIEDRILKKFLQMATRSLSQKKRQSIQEAFREKIKFVIHRSVSNKNQKTQPKDDSSEKPNAAQMALKKKKQDALKNKIEVFRKVQPKLFEANQFFNLEAPEGRKVIQTRQQPHRSSEKHLPRKKSVPEQGFLSNKLKVNSKYQFVGLNEASHSSTLRSPSLSIFNNNFLTLIPAHSVHLPSHNSCEQPLQLLQAPLAKNDESRKSVEFKIRRKEYVQAQHSPEKIRLSWNALQPTSSPHKKQIIDKNLFKNVLESLKKK